MKHTLRATGASIAIAALVVGLPVGLWLAVGWPLPHVMPSFDEFRLALTQTNVSDDVIVKILAVLCWLAWIQIALSFVIEIVATIQCRPARKIRLAGPMQILAAYLVAAVVLSSSPIQKSAPRPLINMPIVQLAVAETAVSPSIGDVSELVETSPVSSAMPTYTVCRRDTLWQIAETYLGDPLRWKEIYQLNKGNVQSDGRSLENANLIRPGWVLQLPADAKIDAAIPETPTVAEQVAPPMSEPTSPVPTTVQVETSTEHHGEVAAPTAVDDETEVRSVAVVSAGFAAGLAGAIALVRLRRRRRYRQSEPTPGIATSDPVVTDRLRKLAQPVVNSEGEVVSLEAATPGVVAIGQHDGEEVSIDLTKSGVIGLQGDDRLNAARATILSFITQHLPINAEVLIGDADLTHALFADQELPPGIRSFRTASDAVHNVEVELLRRTRMAHEEDASDLVELRERCPGEPLPSMLVVLYCLESGLRPRLDALAEQSKAFGIGMLILEGNDTDVVIDVRDNAMSIRTAETDLTVKATPFALSPDDTAETLSVLNAARVFDDEAIEHAPLVVETFESPTVVSEPGEQPCVFVSVLGPPRISVNGKEVSTGFRTSAKELAAFLALRPQGATREIIIDSLWQSTIPTKAATQFRAAIGNLRQILVRTSQLSEADFVQKIGERYLLNPEFVDCDVWHFESALAAVRDRGADELVDCLQRAADCYTGEFAKDAPYSWSAAPQEDLRRRALDVLSRLADEQCAKQQLDEALVTLDRAIAIDVNAEELYRKVLRVQAELGRRDALVRTMQRLTRSLEEIDVEPERETVRLFEELRSGEQGNRVA